MSKLTRFIFFLTYNDVTVENAKNVLDEIKDTGIENIGFKNVGLPKDDLQDLVDKMNEAGINTYMEVVSYEKEKQVEAVMDAGDLGVDYLIGGMPPFVDLTLDIMEKEGFDYEFFPYAGYPVDHPCILRGTIDYIIKDAKRIAELGDNIGGINLLGYRFKDGDPIELLKKYKKSVDIPTIVAGSIDSFKRIDEVKDLGYWGFTIGSAIFDEKIVSGDLRDQVKAIVEKVKE